MSVTRSLEEAEARILLLEQLVSALRHDIKGAITPALLVSDGLRSVQEPRVQRACEKIAQSVLRVTTILDDTREIVPAMRSKAPVLPAIEIGRQQVDAAPAPEKGRRP